MVCAGFMVKAGELTGVAGARDGPVAFVDLTMAPHDAATLRLPSCPVIGIGPPGHPLAAQLDAVLEERFDAQVLANAAAARPLAAAVLAQLLRMLPSLTIEQGLTAESLAYAALQGSAEHRKWTAASAAGPTELAPGRIGLDREEGEDGDGLVITLARPWAGNAMDRPMRDALHEAFALANADPTIVRIRLRALGKAFSLGAELSEFGTTRDPATAHMIRCRTLPAREAMLCAERLEVHVDGACIGAGLELAAFARRITATQRAWFQLPELAMGIIPGAGGCVSLTRRIGRQRTMLMVLSGRRVGAALARQWGLVDALVDDPA